MTWSTGKQLKDGKYTVKRPLAQGGFGVTYLAEDNDLGRKIVIKTINEKLQYEPEFAWVQKNFLKEAQSLARFQHPHIVQVYDIFQENDVSCIVMEYVAGENLYEIVTRKGALLEAEALEYIRQIGDALITVHQHGLLHRDINPRNIILRAGTSNAVLIDFGLAGEFKVQYTTSQLSISHGYSPAEQYASRVKMGIYSDVYSLAATLYFLLTGVTPISAIDRMMGEVLTPANALNKSIQDSVNQAIIQGMLLDAKSRPQSMQEWLQLLGLTIGKDVNYQSNILNNSLSKRVNTFTKSIGFSKLERYIKRDTNNLLTLERKFNYSSLIKINLISFFMAGLSLSLSISAIRELITDKSFPNPTPTKTIQPTIQPKR
jgi:eukaryotic-like serine/threonine-protein kinase